MAACTRCGFQQDGTQTYCERCGMFLPALAIYNPGQTEYSVAPEIASRPNQRFLSTGDLTARMILSRCIREGVAIIGLLIAGFGLFGFFHDILNGYWALFFWFLLLVGGTIAVSFYLFGQKPLPRLRWYHIVLGAVGATAACFIMMIIVSATANNNTLGKDFGYGTTLFFYGLGIVALVVW